VRKLFAQGQAARDDYHTELAALQRLDALRDPQFALLLYYTPPSGVDETPAAGGVIVQRYAGAATPRTAAAKLAVSRLLRTLAETHALFHNDIKWANCVQQISAVSGAPTYSLIDYQWASQDRPGFPYGHGIQRLDLEIGAALPQLRPNELAALSTAGNSASGSEGTKQSVFGIGVDGMVWRVERQVEGDDVQE
jgi:hypothetical protein